MRFIKIVSFTQTSNRGSVFYTIILSYQEIVMVDRIKLIFRLLYDFVEDVAYAFGILKEEMYDFIGLEDDEDNEYY